MSRFLPVVLSCLVACWSSGVAAKETSRCRAAVLVYHNLHEPRAGMTRVQREMNLSPATFEAQMRTLDEGGFAVIPLARLVDCMEGGRELPPHAVVLTFDDGLASQFRVAAPILHQHGFTATFFVVSRMVIGGSTLMDWTQVRALDAMGMTVGSHTAWHPLLTRTSPERLRRELVESRATLEEHLGKPVEFLAYPFGAFDARVAAAARAAGYRAARGIQAGSEHRSGELFGIHIVYPGTDFEAFRRSLL